MGEKAEAVRLDFGGGGERQRSFKLLAFLPVLNNVIFQGLETPGKIQD